MCRLLVLSKASPLDRMNHSLPPVSERSRLVRLCARTCGRLLAQTRRKTGWVWAHQVPDEFAEFQRLVTQRGSAREEHAAFVK